MNCDNLVLLVTAAFSILVIDLALAKDYYKILGVPRDANDRQIKKAFRKLAVKYHPDKNKAKDAEVKFREVAEAYEVLSDEKKRRQYDQFGSEGMNNDGFNFHQGFQSFDDLFKDFDFGFGNGHNQRGGGGGFKFSFGGGFDDFFDDDDDEDDEEDDFFGGGFKFGGFGDSFFSDDSFHSGRHRDDFYSEDNGDRFHRNVRHSEFKQTQSRGRSCRTVTRKVGNMVTTFTDCS